MVINKKIFSILQFIFAIIFIIMLYNFLSYKEVTNKDLLTINEKIENSYEESYVSGKSTAQRYIIKIFGYEAKFNPIENFNHNKLDGKHNNVKIYIKKIDKVNLMKNELIKVYKLEYNGDTYLSLSESNESEISSLRITTILSIPMLIVFFCLTTWSKSKL